MEKLDEAALFPDSEFKAGMSLKEMLLKSKDMRFNLYKCFYLWFAVSFVFYFVSF